MTVTGQILAAAAIISALIVIGRAVWWLIAKVLRPLAQVVEDWRGEPDRPGVPGRPGVMVQLAELRSLLATEATARRALERRMAVVESRLPPLDGPPRLEAGGTAFQAERAFEPDAEGVRVAYGFIGQRSR